MAQRKIGDMVKFTTPQTYIGYEGNRKICKPGNIRFGIVTKVMPSGVKVKDYGFVKHNQLFHGTYNED